MGSDVTTVGHEMIKRNPRLQRGPNGLPQLSVVVAPLFDDFPKLCRAKEVRRDEALARLDVAARLATGIEAEIDFLPVFPRRKCMEGGEFVFRGEERTVAFIQRTVNGVVHFVRRFDR